MDIVSFQQRLDEIRSWRKLELSHARSLAERRAQKAEEPYLCRAWTMMIYAHCDQALKLISQAYLAYLASNPRNDYDYRTVWLAFFGKESLKHASENRYNLCRLATSETHPTLLKNVSGKEIFASGSFSYSLLRLFSDWIIQCNFDHSAYKGFCQTLKEKRDAIAHGEEAYVKSIDDCISWHEPAILLLDGFSEAALDAGILHAK